MSVSSIAPVGDGVRSPNAQCVTDVTEDSDTRVRSYEDFLRNRKTAHEFDMNDRLSLFVDAYERHRAALQRPMRVLDIGCGTDPVLATRLDPDDEYHGCDFYDRVEREIDAYVQVDLNRESVSSKLSGRTYDVVFCGEVIEHLFSPDALLRDVRTLMTDESVLVLSTPNLGYWVNRLLLLAGISPLYLENSAEAKLGRFTKRLGQGNPTEGHIRLFTYRALLDFVDRLGFVVLTTTGTFTWKFPPDRLIARLSHSLAPTNVLVLRRAD
jgi:2-polyprenyl-3-methyl-5-hydroxy-6-metoxy-1,4-benzoquinol methylase